MPDDTQTSIAVRPWIGWATIALGLLHTLATIPAVLDAVPYVAERGVLGGIATEVPPPAEAMPALAALFSLALGAVLLMLGGVIVRLQRSRVPLPKWLGPALMATGLVGGILMPPTGFWLVVALGAWVTAASLRSQTE